MAYKEFKHKGIEYKLYLGNHISSSYPLIKASGGFKDIDILILESGKINSLDLHDFFQYKKIFENIPQDNPELIIYDIDTSFSESLLCKMKDSIPLFGGYYLGKSAIKNKVNNRRDFIKKSVKGLAALTLLFNPGLLVNSFHKGESIDFVNKPTEIIEKIYPSRKISLRNAIVPKIIEGGILPQEKQKIQKIGIVYGAKHFGIEEAIKNPKLRNSILEKYKEEIKEHSEELNQISKIEFDLDHGFKIEKIKLNMF